MKIFFAEAKALVKEHPYACCLGLAAIAGIHVFLFAQTYRGDHLDAATAGQFGDFIGGYLGTIFLIVSVIVLGASFRNQKETNKQTLDDQKSSHERTTFDSRFFELLRYHRENVSEIGIGSKRTGRRVFVSMIREFRDTLKVVDKSCAQVRANYPRDDRIDLAYMAFYYGIGPNSTRVMKDAVEGFHPPELIDDVVSRLEWIQDRYREIEREVRTNATDFDSADYLIRQRWIDKTYTSVVYRPFDGHQSRLGHYYRHLYQLIKFLEMYAPPGVDKEYAGIVRAQLSNHEQALLCLNSMSQLGLVWRTAGYLTKYSLIRNIPKSFFDIASDFDLKAEFPDIVFEFETIYRSGWVEMDPGAD